MHGPSATLNAGAAEHTTGLWSQFPVSHRAALQVSPCLLIAQLTLLETFFPWTQLFPSALAPSGSNRALTAQLLGVQVELLHPEVESHVVLVHVKPCLRTEHDDWLPP
jgi:hypothetical protein